MLKTVVIACLTMLLAESALAQSATSLNSDVRGDLDDAILQIGQAYLNADEGVGLSIGIVDDGRFRFYNLGSVEKGENRAPTEETLYEIGSISKTFTGLLLARAVVDGKVNLEDEIDDHLPEKYDNLSFGGQRVRVVHLANMTSGIPNDLPDVSQQASPEDLTRRAAKVGNLPSRDDFFRDLHAVRLTEKPGGNPAHSNAAAQLLGYIVENSYGSPLDEVIPRLIEAPCKMHSGSASGDRPCAPGYNDHGTEVAASGPATGLRYGTYDMVKYIAHQLDEQDEAVALSHRPTWDTLDKQQSIAFFWILSKATVGRRLRYSGSTPGFTSFCDLYPDQKLGIVLLANNSNPQAQDRLKLASENIVDAIRKEAVQH